MNGFDAQRASFLDADVNASLRQFDREGQRFDAIVLDPPKFAPTVAHAERAARAYKDINRLAFKLLAPDGVLADEKFHGAYTWAAWYLRRMARETQALTLPDAVHRLTGLPAQRLELRDRGRIAKGYCADIVVLDWLRYTERGTERNPSQLADGVVHLLVNGVPTMRHGSVTGERGGQLLRS